MIGGYSGTHLRHSTRCYRGRSHPTDRPVFLRQRIDETVSQSRDDSCRRHVFLLPLRASGSEGCDEGRIQTILMHPRQINPALEYSDLQGIVDRIREDIQGIPVLSPGDLDNWSVGAVTIHPRRVHDGVVAWDTSQVPGSS